MCGCVGVGVCVHARVRAVCVCMRASSVSKTHLKEGLGARQNVGLANMLSDLLAHQGH